LTIHLEPCIYISMKLEKASAQLEALGHPVRLRIFRLLVRAGLDGLPVGAVQDKLDMPRQLSRHAEPPRLPHRRMLRRRVQSIFRLRPARRQGDSEGPAMMSTESTPPPDQAGKAPACCGAR
jgi:DNA-binding transcriptional ArsR family regulator